MGRRGAVVTAVLGGSAPRKVPPTRRLLQGMSERVGAGGKTKLLAKLKLMFYKTMHEPSH